jgi:2-methylcitrate dehydratase PrpD
VEVHVEHAVGSLQRPMTDAQLDSKFSALVSPVLGAQKVGAIAEACRRLATLDDVRSLTALCRP